MKPRVVQRPFGDKQPSATLYYGADCRDTMWNLPAKSVHTVVTSPPYWGLRDYGTGDLQIGLEKTPEEFVEAMVDVFREVKRVLRDDGTLWLNLGDSYAGAGPSGASYQSETTKRRASQKQDGNFTVSKSLGERGLTYKDKKPVPPPGLKSKDLVGIPWRVALALQKDGWYLRSDIIWAKKSTMPESVKDRPTRAHEYLFLLTKSRTYFYDHVAIKEPATRGSAGSRFDSGKTAVNMSRTQKGYRDTGDQRNKRSVWHVNPVPYKGAHFAVFPPQLVTPCVLAGSSEKGCCPMCGTPWERVVVLEGGSIKSTGTGEPVQGNRKGIDPKNYDRLKIKGAHGVTPASCVTTGWEAACGCPPHEPVPCKVLDPFSGSGTTGMVALDHGRDYVGLDLSEDYLDMAEARLLGEPPPSSADTGEDGGLLDLLGVEEG